jgi:hypothetical protein
VVSSSLLIKWLKRISLDIKKEGFGLVNYSVYWNVRELVGNYLLIAAIAPKDAFVTCSGKRIHEGEHDCVFEAICLL